jgi:hypothetical protein
MPSIRVYNFMTITKFADQAPWFLKSESPCQRWDKSLTVSESVMRQAYPNMHASPPAKTMGTLSDYLCIYVLKICTRQPNRASEETLQSFYQARSMLTEDVAKRLRLLDYSPATHFVFRRFSAIYR